MLEIFFVRIVPGKCYKFASAARGSPAPENIRSLFRVPQRLRRKTDSQKKEGKMHFIVWILIGLIAGWITGKIMKGSGYGFFVDILLGIAGGFVGGYIARLVGFERSGFFWSILIAVVGAVILVFLFRLITGKR
jgi:uncharacterized membrane protein YeaQ/YmgE (transglycosylase-associated protein family)